MYQYLKSKYNNVFILGCKSTVILYENGKYKIKIAYPKQFVEIGENDIFIIRKTYKLVENSKRIVEYLNKDLKNKFNLKLYSSSEMIDFCSDKYRGYLFFKENNIPTPLTYYLPRVDLKSDDKILDKIANKVGFPCIIKPLDGSQGTGVIKIESKEQVKAISEMIYQNNGAFILQSYIESEYDVRVFTLNSKIIGCMRRNKIPGDFRSNFSKGSTTEVYQPTEEELSLFNRVIKSVSEKMNTSLPIGTMGMDFIKGVDGNSYFLEINASPGMEGISKTYNKSFPKLVAHYILKEEGLI